MHFRIHRQIRHRKTNQQFEHPSPVKSTEKPVRKISRCPTKDAGETSGSGQPTEEALRDNSKLGILEDSLPRFGPLLPVDQPSVEATKKEAWDNILRNLSQEDHNKITQNYVEAIREVEQQAIETYADKITIIGSNFRWMMIRDGCFFLQLALLILGCSEQFKYPENDPIFEARRNKKDIKKWIEAMFFVGNQIPLVVLKKLMNQNYFQEVISKGKWYPAPSGLCKKLLYELLVLPALNRNSPNQGNMQQPCDLLHGLHIMVIGDDLSNGDEADDGFDLEANEEDIDDYEANYSSIIDDDNETSSPSDKIRKILNAISFLRAIDDRKRIFPCATELKRAGISIKKVKGGIKAIDFQSYYFWAFLYLPAFPVDDNAEMIFRNLKNYEKSQQMAKHRREASSYLKFMSDIIQTTKDAKLLLKKGVIQGDPIDAEKLPRTLSRLSSEDVRLTHEFHVLRRKIRDYSSPWIHYKGVVNLVVFLTLLQTLFALLAYFKPPKS